MIGMFQNEDLRFEENIIEVEKGDILFLYTDGLIENSGPSGQTMKPRILKKVLGSTSHPEQLKEDILSSGREIWQDQSPEDDCTFLILNWKGPQKKLQNISWLQQRKIKVVADL